MTSSFHFMGMRQLGDVDVEVAKQIASYLI